MMGATETKIESASASSAESRFSPLILNELVASCGRHDRIRLFHVPSVVDVTSEDCESYVRKSIPSEAGFKLVRLTPDHLAMGELNSEDSRIVIYNLHTGSEVGSVHAHPADTDALARVPYCSGLGDSAVRLLASGMDLDPILILRSHVHKPRPGGRDHTVALFDVRSALSPPDSPCVSSRSGSSEFEFREMSRFVGHEGDIYGLCSAIPIRNWLVSGSWDSDIRLWDLVKGSCVGVVAGDSRAVMECRMGGWSWKTGPYLFGVGAAMEAKVIDLRSGLFEIVATLTHECPVYFACVPGEREDNGWQNGRWVGRSGSGGSGERTVLTGDHFGDIRFWDIRMTTRAVKTLTHLHSTFVVLAEPNSNSFSAELCGRSKKCRRDTREVGDLLTHSAVLEAMRVCQVFDFTRLFAGIIQFFSFPSGKVVRTLRTGERNYSLCSLHDETCLDFPWYDVGGEEREAEVLLWFQERITEESTELLSVTILIEGGKELHVSMALLALE